MATKEKIKAEKYNAKAETKTSSEKRKTEDESDGLTKELKQVKGLLTVYCS